MPSKVLKDFWFEQLKSVFKGKVIGICWKGGNTSGQLKKRSLGLKDIMINLPKNGNYVNLQYGSVEKEIEEVGVVGTQNIHEALGIWYPSHQAFLDLMTAPSSA